MKKSLAVPLVLSLSILMLVLSFSWIEALSSTLPPESGVLLGDVLVDRATGIDAAGCGTGAHPPCRSIAYALTNVALANDRVLVAPGTYTETFILQPHVAVVSQSGPAATIIDGEGVRGPLVSAYDPAITHTSRLEGFTITGSDYNGLYITGGAPLITGCVVTENRGDMYGGGIAILYSSASPWIVNSQIVSNTAQGIGGGIIIIGGAEGLIENSYIAYNQTVDHWGGGIAIWAATGIISGNLIAHNTAPNHGGGGIQIFDASSAFDIRNNIIELNHASGSGGIGIGGGSGVFADNIVKNNSATDGTGGINVSDVTQVDIYDNWVISNSTRGLRVWNAGTRIENNFIIGDVDQHDQVQLGGTGHIELVNNSIVGPNAGTGIQVNADDHYTITNNIISDNNFGISAAGTSLPTVNNNLLWNNPGGNYQGLPPGSGDVVADPDYVAPTVQDYHLDVCSWAVEAGDNLEAPANDYDGDPRPIDGDGDGNAVSDIGADERAGVAAPMPSAAFTYTINGAAVTFTNLSSHTVSYLWDFGDGGTSTQANPVHTYGNPGNYTVLLAAANLNGCSDQEQHLVTTQVAGDITAPAAIIPFTATMGLAPRSVEIFWTAPGDDGAGGGSAAQYDIRYSENPIDDANWTSATPLLYPFSPKAPGSSERHAIASLTLGKRWYFAIKAVDEAGNWSAISNVPSVQEMGFRGSDDGYLLPNYGGVNYLDYSLDDMRRMFGDTAVCYMSGSLCTPKPEAAWWNLLVNQNMSGGHADGMASTSLRFFEDLDDPGNLKPGATSIQDLNLADSRRHIAYYHVEQYADPAALMRWQSAQGNPVGVLAALRSQIYSNLHDPALIFIHQGGMGHSLVPFGIEERPDGVVWVWVYDSNYPSNFSTSPGRILTIDPAANTWSYDLGWATWSGDANTHSLGIIPISVYAQQPLAPWVTAPSHAPGGGDSVQIWLTGAGHLLATDGQGRRVGYAGGQYLNEIPGASYNTSSGGLGLTLEPVYALPVTSTHTILLEGTSLTQTNTISVTQFGSGYAVGVHNVPAAAPGLESPTAAGSLFIPGDGSEVAYTAFSAQEVDLLLTREFAGQSLQCTIGGADAGPLEKVVLLLDEANQRMGYSADEAGNGEYDLEIEWISAQGTDRFYHADIPIAAGDRHYVAYTSAGGFLEITIGIDHDGNGTIDDSFVVMNQAWQVQLPMVLGPP